MYPLLSTPLPKIADPLAKKDRPALPGTYIVKAFIVTPSTGLGLPRAILDHALTRVDLNPDLGKVVGVTPRSRFLSGPRLPQPRAPRPSQHDIEIDATKCTPMQQVRDKFGYDVYPVGF
jgi:hypothetical protein